MNKTLVQSALSGTRVVKTDGKPVSHPSGTSSRANASPAYRSNMSLTRWLVPSITQSLGKNKDARALHVGSAVRESKRVQKLGIPTSLTLLQFQLIRREALKLAQFRRVARSTLRISNKPELDCKCTYNVLSVWSDSSIQFELLDYSMQS